MTRKTWASLVFLSLLLSLAVPLLQGGLDTLAGIARIPLWAMALLLAMVLGGWLFNAARIRLLAGTLGVALPRQTAYRTVVAAEFASTATPGGTGGPATYLLLLTRHGLPVGRAAGMVAIDNVIDLVFFATSIPIALVIYNLDSGVAHPLRLAGLVTTLIIAGVALLVWLLHHYRPVALWIGRILRRFHRLRRTRYRLARWLIQFRHSVQLLLTMPPSRLLLLYLFCVGHWMLRYGILPVLLWVLGEPISWGYLFLIQSLLLVAGQATFLPGGGGGVEIGFSALMRTSLDAATLPLALLAWRFFTFHAYLLIGAPVFAFATGRRIGELLAAAGTAKTAEAAEATRCRDDRGGPAT